MKLEKSNRFKGKLRLLGALTSNGYLRDIRLFKAFLEVSLEDFIPPQYISQARLYDDIPNLFYFQNEENYRTISAPHMICIMLQGLALSPDDDLLILGAKSGYIAALAHMLAPKGKIIILEANSDVAKITTENLKKLNFNDFIQVIVKNPLEGMLELSPWQKILVTGAINQERIYPLLKQLDPEEGVLFAPIGEDIVQTYTQILRIKNEYFGKKQLQVRFTPLMTQIELDELELVTNFEDIEIKDDPKKVEETLNRVNVKYVAKEIDDFDVDSNDIKDPSVQINEHQLTIAFLENIDGSLNTLKMENKLDLYSNCIENIETQIELLNSFKKEYRFDAKKIQGSLNQLKSNRSPEEIDKLQKIVEKEIERIKKE